jgi:eukaryotic-like serine/threonine-protein kinase
MLAGRYLMEGRIASGGMGEVWRAVDLVLGRPVAVKLLQQGYAEHAETLARFRAEARHAAAVMHPAIAQVYDYCEASSGLGPFLVMEFVDGPPLTRLLTAGPLEPARVLDVVAQAADGLGAAHAAGLVHRDIKPGNLLIGPGDTVKITDFGIAYAAGSAPLTRTGTVIGTPAYMAPERVAGASAGPSSDLYSLGIVAYECLAGSTPYSGTSMEIALAHRHQSLPPLPGRVPSGITALVAAMTAKEPAHRPPGARQVAACARQLRGELQGSAADAAPAGPPRDASTRQFTTGPRAHGDMPTATLTNFGSQQEQPPRGRRLREFAARRPVLLAAAAVVILIIALGGWLLAAGLTPAAHHSSRPHLASAPKPPTVAISSSLIGQQVGPVSQQLSQLGLQVTVKWQFTPSQQPGTVLAIQPDGRVRADSAVVVTAASPIPGFGHGHHNGGFGGFGGSGGSGNGGDGGDGGQGGD